VRYSAVIQAMGVANGDSLVQRGQDTAPEGYGAAERYIGQAWSVGMIHSSPIGSVVPPGDHYDHCANARLSAGATSR
jgi:hypothetical protein